MHWMYTIVVLCLLLLLDNAESFKLIQNGLKVNKHKLHPHLKKQSFELQKSTSVTRQSHTCIINCDVTLSFHDSLVLPEECTRIETDNACEIFSTIDYLNQQIYFYFYENAESLTIDNVTYNSATLHIAYFEYSDNSQYHFFDYACAIGNDCEWEYMKQIIPKLIILDYQPLFNSLSPIVNNSNGQPDITECYDDTTLVNCSSGSCEFLQSADSNYQLEIHRECAVFEESSVEIGKARFLPGPAKHDYDIIGFICNKNKCNGQSSEYEIKDIISSIGNEYISSLGIKSQWTCFSLYFLYLVLIKI